MIAGLMLYSVEIALAWTNEKAVFKETFYRSMLKSFDEALAFIEQHALKAEFAERVRRISVKAHQQRWPNAAIFEKHASGIGILPEN